MPPEHVPPSCPLAVCAADDRTLLPISTVCSIAVADAFALQVVRHPSRVLVQSAGRICAGALVRGDQVLPTPRACRRYGQARMSVSPAQTTGTQEMKWASSCQVSFSDLQEAVDDSVAVCKAELGGKPEVDLALMFISSRFTESRGGATPIDQSDLDRAMETVKRELGAKHILGCLGGGVLGMGEERSPEEFEDFKAVSICCAKLPGVEIAPFRLSAKDVPGNDGTQQDWCNLLGGTSPLDEPVIICMAEPQMSASPALNTFLEGLDFAYPGCVKVGGLAAPSLQSQSTLPSVFSSWSTGKDDTGQFGLPLPDFLSGGVGAGAKKTGPIVAGIALTGNIAAEPLVAQGCRGIGGVYEVAKVDRNMLLAVTEVGKSKEMTSLELLQEVIQGLSPADVQLAQTSLFLGVASDSMKFDASRQSESENDEFLIRQVVGVSVKEQGLVVADVLRPGQRVRLHVRDRDAAVDDVELLMSGYKRKRLTAMMTGSAAPPPAAGVLLFSCLGRGRALFNEANYDSRMAHISTGVPVAGVFCNGEIGPVHGSSRLLGFTSVFTLLRQKTALTQPPP